MNADLKISTALRVRKIAHEHLKDARRYEEMGRPDWHDKSIESAMDLLNNARWMLWLARSDRDFAECIEWRRANVQYRRAA